MKFKNEVNKIVILFTSLVWTICFCFACLLFSIRNNSPKIIPINELKLIPSVTQSLATSTSTKTTFEIMTVIVSRYTQTPYPTMTPVSSSTPVPNCSCESDLYNCGDFENRIDAQVCFDYCSPVFSDIHNLDQDDDGYVCEVE